MVLTYKAILERLLTDMDYKQAQEDYSELAALEHADLYKVTPVTELQLELPLPKTGTPECRCALESCQVCNDRIERDRYRGQ